uniref:Uncharacterized protein n=1 Tax=Rhizophora mucronata TaxID=61149 RepID=A0A2P2P4P8_RHIMU
MNISSGSQLLNIQDNMISDTAKLERISFFGFFVPFLEFNEIGVMPFH